MNFKRYKVKCVKPIYIPSPSRIEIYDHRYDTARR